MAEGMGQERWSRTAMVCALLANIHRDPKRGRPFKPDDFNPYARGRTVREVATSDDLAALRRALERK